MRSGKRSQAVYFLLFVLFIMGHSTEVDAQFMTTVNCLFPKNWESRQAMIVAKPLFKLPIIDTVTIASRTAVFTINLPEPSPAYLWVEGNKDDIQFFIDSPRINIGFEPTASVSTLITGSPSSELWAGQLSAEATLRDSRPDLHADLVAALGAGDTLLVFSLEERIDSLQQADNTLTASTILEHPTLASSWYLFASTYFPYEQTLDLFSKLSAFSLYSSYKKIDEKLARNRVGSKAPDFIVPTTTGSTSTLTRLTHNYILLDFSASTIFPSRKRQFDLKKLYQKYHSLGLEIITISLDFDKENAKKMFSKAGLPWLQVLDTMDSASIMNQYSIERIPDCVLLDKTKTILGRNMSMRSLDARLSQLLMDK